MNKQGRGIWRFRDFFPVISDKYQLTLNEGNTSLKYIDGIFFKCEYENPTGSVKDRGLAYQVSKLKEAGVSEGVISSSGNAAISASAFCKLANINLYIFVSDNINRGKLKKLKEINSHILIRAKPLSDAVKFAKEKNVPNLRQSTDRYATYGYETIAYELLLDEPDIDAVFFPVSSGTTLTGVFHGFLKKMKLPAVHAVQTTKVNPIASSFDKDYQSALSSLADALVARYTSRHGDVREIIKKSEGWGWVISDTEILQAFEWLHKNRLYCSYEGACTLAAYRKALRKGYKYNKPVCLLTGKAYL